jgi:hypothetical protein
MLDEITMQRLGLIRYLYEAAMEESRRPEPFGSISILKFHDSIELFLDLACDRFGIPAKKAQQFRDYWTELERHLQGQSLSEKRSMDRLNDARVSFKHHGNLPHASSIERFRVNVTDFFEDNTALIFGIDFSKVSMTYLIQNNVVKTLLDEATTLLEQGARGDALDKIAVAFAELISDYLSGNQAWRYQNLFFSRGPSLRYTSPTTGNRDRQLEEFAAKVSSSIESLREGMQILSLGLDYQRYVRFRLMTPPVVRMMGATMHQALHGNLSDQNELPSIERCRFCYDFVVASAIHLQNLDFEVEM